MWQLLLYSLKWPAKFEVLWSSFPACSWKANVFCWSGHCTLMSFRSMASHVCKRKTNTVCCGFCPNTYFAIGCCNKCNMSIKAIDELSRPQTSFIVSRSTASIITYYEHSFADGYEKFPKDTYKARSTIELHSTEYTAQNTWQSSHDLWHIVARCKYSNSGFKSCATWIEICMYENPSILVRWNIKFVRLSKKTTVNKFFRSARTMQRQSYW
jgi:hypothetical protein